MADIENKNLETEESKGTENKDKNKDESTKDESTKDLEKSKETNVETKSFTQEQLNRMMAREKTQGKNSILTELGIKPDDKQAIAALKSYIASQKTDDEKAKEANDEKDRALSEANRRALIAEVKAEVMKLGVQPKYVDDAVTLILPKVTDETDLNTLVGELKTKYDSWFENVDDKPSKRGTGSSAKPNNDSKGAEKGMGARLAAERNKKTKKASYWG